MTLDEILARLDVMPEETRREVEAEALKATRRRYFTQSGTAD
jgi:hypothetical protein